MSSLKLAKDSLEFALEHITVFGDTDVFAPPFEFNAIKKCWDQEVEKISPDGNHSVKDYLLQQNLLDFKHLTGAPRRCWVPKHKHGLRLCTQLDPMDAILFTALVYEIGAELEKERLPENVVFSYRFNTAKPAKGRFFTSNVNFRSFQAHSQALINEHKYSHVVVADIADFYNQLYHHRLENMLKKNVDEKYVKAIMNFLLHYSNNTSYGLPVGGSASRLLAEITLHDIDVLMYRPSQYNYSRFSDDFRIFCTSAEQAYHCLVQLHQHLYSVLGHSLQQHKTSIMTVEEFKCKTFPEYSQPSLSQKLMSILDRVISDATYTTIVWDDLKAEEKAAVSSLGLEKILEQQVQMPDIDISVVSFVLNWLSKFHHVESVDLVINHLEKLFPVTKEVVSFLATLDKKKLLNPDKKKTICQALLKSFDTISGFLGYHKSLMFTLMSDNPESWGLTLDTVNLVERNLWLDPTDKSFIEPVLLVLKSKFKNAGARLFSQRTTYASLGCWQRRAFLTASLNAANGDEVLHWAKNAVNYGMERILLAHEKTK